MTQLRRIHLSSSSISTVDPRVVIYARYSTNLQRDASNKDQVRNCRALTDLNGWHVQTVYTDDAITGSELDSRKGYSELLASVRSGEIDIIVSESLDRLSRHRTDLPYLCDLCESLGVKIITLIENEVDEITSAVKGLTNVLFFKDLAMKTRRGLKGRVIAGASAGGLSYGYDVVSVPEGQDRGARAINAIQAAVVVRIFRLYAAGMSPKKIAALLNQEGVSGPRGNGWTQSSINGNRKRGTGVLNNQLYAGFLVWNRLKYFKDPDTRKRRSRLNPIEDLVVTEVPDLRIVDGELWDAVRMRQAGLDATATPAKDGTTFQSKQRPKHLFSKLLTCGCCSGGFSMISATHLGCSNARNKGDTFCTNRRTIKRSVVEAKVLESLQTRLMNPQLYEAFVRGFIAEWNREQAARDAEHVGKRDELMRVEKKIGNLVEAIGASGGSNAILISLKEAEARKAVLEGEIAAAEAPAPRLMPNLADLYRVKVEALHEALQTDDAATARDRLRALINAIHLIPSLDDPAAPLQIEVRGDLAAILALGSGSSEAASEALASQFKLVAGARNHRQTRGCILDFSLRLNPNQSQSYDAVKGAPRTVSLRQ